MYKLFAIFFVILVFCGSASIMVDAQQNPSLVKKTGSVQQRTRVRKKTSIVRKFEPTNIVVNSFCGVDTNTFIINMYGKPLFSKSFVILDDDFAITNMVTANDVAFAKRMLGDVRTKRVEFVVSGNGSGSTVATIAIKSEQLKVSELESFHRRLREEAIRQYGQDFPVSFIPIFCDGLSPEETIILRGKDIPQ